MTQRFGNRQQCQSCGEWMAHAIMRTAMDSEGHTVELGYFCQDCMDEPDGERQYRKRSNMGGIGGPATKTDMDYHGSLFNRGEW